jgi:hypothetical protein
MVWEIEMTKNKSDKTERLIQDEGGPTHKEVKKPGSGLFGGFFDRLKGTPSPTSADDNQYKPPMSDDDSHHNKP